MNMKMTKARHFGFLLYPDSIPENWREQLESLGVSMAVSPLHDKDKNSDGTLKKPHYHVIYIARNPVTIESVRKKIKRKLGNSSVAHIEIIDHIKGSYEYLTHESKDAKAKNKYVYDKKDILHINGFDIDRYVTLDESQKKELRNQLFDLINHCGIVNMKELAAFLDWRGQEYGIANKRDVIDVIASNSNLFRMLFDANYQNGFRPQYAKRIDAETGEMIEGAGNHVE
ncbi:replication protein [Enterococcus faecium]|uniref:replication protein n=1 Tax=Enterococcus faecium TaxID=1352 RepID=UPI000A5E93C5|nr:replication protein [Enterococcus faecium]MDW7819805.1 replication protein [Enterococcus faecium]MDW7871432.1 replication protein [Enterococcus faecium]MDW7902299.1 replication protein [Enterococcus faecium]MDW7918590.1 replication protein [Enterococcus faecium]GMS43634.1 replication protein [Enterococcus faecium]